jgi:hypothetical protein
MKRGKIETLLNDTAPEYSGYCYLCDKNHHFPGSHDHKAAYALMSQLESERQIADNLPTSSLFGEMRGKMFGVMTCLADDGTIVKLKAFSGQFNGGWLAAGWVGPLFDVERWNAVNSPAEQTIKNLDQSIDVRTGQEKRRLLLERRKLSRALMKDLHALYRLTNFSGRTVTFADIIPQNRGIPTGTGDCCAPKLLHHAACHNLVPLSLCEFYWGRENRSGTRRHRNLYLPCREKCAPLLGFMLCGLEELYEQRNL